MPAPSTFSRSPMDLDDSSGASDTESVFFGCFGVNISLSKKKRGRSRPPITGEYVDLAQAKRLLLEAQRLERQEHEEQLMLENRVAVCLNDLEPKTVKEISDLVQVSLGQVKGVASTSGHLKGT